jgi:hypothetical protein
MNLDNFTDIELKMATILQELKGLSFDESLFIVKICLL